MTLRTRLILTIGGVALLLVLPAVLATQQLAKLRDIAMETRDVHGAAYLALGAFQTNLVALDQLQRRHVALREPVQNLVRDSAVAAARLALNELAAAGYPNISARARIHLDSTAALIEWTDALLRAGRQGDATDTLVVHLRPLTARTSPLLRSMVYEIDRRVEANLEEARRISTGAVTSTLLALVASFFVAVLLGIWATHTLVRPIHRLRRGMAAVAAGEFVVPEGLPYSRSDEIGDVSRSFRAMTQQLADLDRMKADFMSIATHELKTPINVISGYAELIQDGIYGPITEKQDDALTAMQEQSRNLTQLINQLLDISRLEAGGLKLEIGVIDLTELLERMRRTFDGLALRQEITLDFSVDDDAPQHIPGDADRLRDQVFGNILSNAMKFTPPGGSIYVHAFGTKDGLVVEVSDTGPGIAADQLPHVFDKYYQIGEHARSKGAGLGLTIAHEVVHAHAGKLTVESVEGRGTTFRILLPTRTEKADFARRTTAVGSARSAG